MTASPMFPLGTVLFPSLVLPLHVFEPRYRTLVHDVLEGDQHFGVVLIERGSEVGGGDVRSSVGTMARLVESQELPDGRWAIVAVGTHRVRVGQWLDDDPYPRAEVADWPDEDRDAAGDLDLGPVLATLRRALAAKAELGEPAQPATVEIADDPVLASYQACAVAPVGPLDQQRLLEAETVVGRVELLQRLLDEELAVLDLRLGE